MDTNTNCPCGSQQKHIYLDGGTQECMNGHMYHTCIDNSIIYGTKKCFWNKILCEKKDFPEKTVYNW